MKIIYNDDVYSYMHLYKNDLIEFLNENEIEPQPNELEDAAYLFINDDLESIKSDVKRFDNKNNYKILVVADLGLWRGRVNGKATYKNLYDAVFDNMQDTNILYFKNVNSTLTLGAQHHDGCNYFKFYKLVKGKKYAINFKELIEE